MGSNERGAIISAGLTGSFGAVLAGLNLAFPDMIVPFGWALTLLVIGLLGAFVTIAYAALWLIQPKSRRQRIQSGIRPFSEKLRILQQRFKQAQTPEEVEQILPELSSVLTSTGDWIAANMGPSALEKFREPEVDSGIWSWPGQGGEAAEKRSNILVLNGGRLAVLDTFLRYDGWDGDDPTLWQRMTKRIGIWKNRKIASTSF